ncbi:MAG TPA: peptide chain release factor N(5)-glutamine methyltransferase [Thermomicrobiales bacterium]|nr:peptide chain release factor N(5)-glutamine methyltransferase [Thermomicrobiales bacterium]
MKRGVPGTPRAVRDVLAQAAAHLGAADVESPRLDAEVLLLHLLGWERAQLYAALADPLPDEVAEQYAALLAERVSGVPVAYLVGAREFMGLPFAVGPGVLVPRPETECLVEWLAGRVRAEPRWRAAVTIADVGTGSGAIALSLAQLLPQARIVAIERSPAALRYTRRNRAALDLDNRVLLVHGDLLGPAGAVNVIAANLPYLRPDQLHAGIAAEPVEALVAGPDGLDLYRALLPQAAARLRTPGLLAAEIDPSQATAMVALGHAAFPDAVIGVERDLAGRDRFLTVERRAG